MSEVKVLKDYIDFENNTLFDVKIHSARFYMAKIPGWEKLMDYTGSSNHFDMCGGRNDSITVPEWLYDAVVIHYSIYNSNMVYVYIIPPVDWETETAKEVFRKLQNMCTDEFTFLSSKRQCLNDLNKQLENMTKALDSFTFNGSKLTTQEFDKFVEFISENKTAFYESDIWDEYDLGRIPVYTFSNINRDIDTCSDELKRAELEYAANCKEMVDRFKKTREQTTEEYFEECKKKYWFKSY